MKLILGVFLCALYLEMSSRVLKKKVHKINSGANDEGGGGTHLLLLETYTRAFSDFTI
jgi:hypothetical protein